MFQRLKRELLLIKGKNMLPIGSISDIKLRNRQNETSRRHCVCHWNSQNFDARILSGFNIYVSWYTSELRVRLAPLNRFKPSSKIFYRPFQCGTSFVDLLCFCSVLCLLCLCARLFICALWSPAGKRADLLALVCGVYCEFVTFPLVSWVRCGTWLYRFLIFAPLLT